jgi:D-Tyr-tRNAtyr deacylase
MEQFIGTLRDQCLFVEIGEFGATMTLHLINDGPVTIWPNTHDWVPDRPPMDTDI